MGRVHRRTVQHQSISDVLQGKASQLAHIRSSEDTDDIWISNPLCDQDKFRNVQEMTYNHTISPYSAPAVAS